MQIESLKMFCDLVETKSFTKTAQINQVTQSAISQQISSLERLFKSVLIDRSTRNLRITSEGQVLYDHSSTPRNNLPMQHRFQPFAGPKVCPRVRTLVLQSYLI